MRIADVHAVHDAKKIEPLLFFAECLAELLFDHTMDSYKAPALDTITRALELATLARDAGPDDRAIRRLRPVIEELAWSLEDDPVIKGDVRIMANRLLEQIQQNADKPSVVAETTDALLLHLRNYWPLTRSLILECLKDSKRKKDLLSLAAILTTQIELFGFSRRYAYHLTEQLHARFKSDTPIPDVDTIAKEFLANFDQPEKDFKVIYRVNSEFAQYAEHAKDFGMAITNVQTEQIENPSFRVTQFLGASAEFPGYLTTARVEARDNFSAREDTDRVLEQFIEAVKFHRHTSELAASEICAVVEIDSHAAVVLKPSPHPLTCGRETSWTLASAGIETTTEILGGAHLDGESTRKFANVLEYHRAAIDTPKLENQLLDLWAALEGFLPQPRGQTRIGHYLAALLPPITLTYPEKLFQYITDELKRPELGVGVKQFIEQSAPSGDLFEKTVRLILAEELYLKLETLMSMLNKSPLLRFRIYKLHESFKTADAIQKTLRSHRTKVGWHIQRIYGTRNMIMHSAEALRYLRTLVENLHGYLDTLLPAVARLAVESPQQADIHSAIQLLKNHEEVMLSSLGAVGKQRCNEANFKGLAFGGSNPLSPFVKRMS